MDRRTILLGSLGLALPAAAQNAQTKSLTVVARAGELADTKLYTNSFAVLIGIQYDHFPKEKRLPNTTDDVNDLKDLLVRYYGFQSENIVTLTKSDASKRQIEKQLSQLATKGRLKETDRVLLYFSGHGQTIKTSDGGDMGFIIPDDAQIDLSKSDDPAPYLSDCIAMDGLWKFLEACPARHRLLILDSCFGGLLVQPKAVGSNLSPSTIDGFLAVPALQAIVAGGKEEESFVLPGLRNSAFTHKLLELLRQAAASGLVVTASELGAGLKSGVPDLVRTRHPNRRSQTPQFGSRGTEGEFLFVSNRAIDPPGRREIVEKSLRSGLEFIGGPPGLVIRINKNIISGTRYEVDLVDSDMQDIDVVLTASGYKSKALTYPLVRGKLDSYLVKMESDTDSQFEGSNKTTSEVIGRRAPVRGDIVLYSHSFTDTVFEGDDGDREKKVEVVYSLQILGIDEKSGTSTIRVSINQLQIDRTTVEPSKLETGIVIYKIRQDGSIASKKEEGGLKNTERKALTREMFTRNPSSAFFLEPVIQTKDGMFKLVRVIQN